MNMDALYVALAHFELSKINSRLSVYCAERDMLNIVSNDVGLTVPETIHRKFLVTEIYAMRTESSRITKKWLTKVPE